MINPILQKLNQKTNPVKQMPLTNNPASMIQNFINFTQNMTPDKAKEILENKIRSGEISQAQFEDLKNKANLFNGLFKKSV